MEGDHQSCRILQLEQRSFVSTRYSQIISKTKRLEIEDLEIVNNLKLTSLYPLSQNLEASQIDILNI